MAVEIDFNQIAALFAVAYYFKRRARWIWRDD
jgi:hypothetical protein